MEEARADEKLALGNVGREEKTKIIRSNYNEKTKDRSFYYR